MSEYLVFCPLWILRPAILCLPTCTVPPVWRQTPRCWEQVRRGFLSRTSSSH